MGRLTRRIIKKFPNHTTEAIELNSEWGKMDIHADEEFYDIADKLAHYEDLEEQGRLVEVRYGEWKPILYDSKCSVCGYSETTPLMIMRRDFKYCPSCGAKMLKELEGVKE